MPGRTPDIWMLEMLDRRGKFWKGRFNVEFFKEHKNDRERGTTVESQTGRLFFTLDTETAEVTFNIDTGPSPENVITKELSFG